MKLKIRLTRTLIVIVAGVIVGWLAYKFSIKIPVWAVLLLLATTLMSFWLWWHLNGRLQNARRSKEVPRPYEFICFPEFFPSGYVAFTEHHAMQVELHKALSDCPPDKQFEHLGFGKGFLTEVVERLGFGKDQCRRLPRARIVIPKEDKTILDQLYWLSKLQLSGVDNAPPSTINLMNQLLSEGEKLVEFRPVTLQSQTKNKHEMENNVDGISLSQTEFDHLLHVFKSSEELGRAAAMAANIELPKGYQEANPKP